MKKVVQTLAKIIGSSFYLIEFLLIFFPLYYFFMLFFYLVVFLFDEGLLNLIKWEENKYAKITTQAFDSFLHLYYYFFYIISLFVAVIHVFMAGLGNYLVSKIYKDPDEKHHHHHDVSTDKKEIRNGISDYVPKGRKRKALLNICKYIVVASILSFLNIYGNFLLRDYFPHTLGIELLFVLLAFGYSRTIYSHVYSYKNNKKNHDEQDFIGIPMGYGIMKSVFWGYILLFEIVSEIKVEVGV